MVDLYLLDQNHRVQDYIEGYESFIWTERYDEHGDAVLQFSLKHKRPADFPKRWYLSLDGSDELMIIDSAEVGFDPDNGRVLEIRARALTSLLTRRIIWNQLNLTGNLETAVKTILDRNIIADTTSARNIPNLSFAYSGGTVPSVYTVEAQYQGEDLYSAISDLCKSYDIGFRMTSPTRGQFRFQLYGGVDRSYEQTLVPYVVFSPEFDNLANGRYFTSHEDYCNVVRVGGEGAGNKKVYEIVTRPGVSISGVNRFEHYHDAENLSSNDEEIPGHIYRQYLQQQGREYLTKHEIEHVFDGETDPTNSFGYGTDYFLGDMVQISDDDIISSPARIVEYIRSDNKSDGYQEFPALRVKNENDE